MGPSHFKNRPLTEANIQETISQIVSKYMSPDFPPWQVKIIPLANESAFYMMIRIHHLILDEQKNLHVSDMMLLDRSKGTKLSLTMLSDDQKRLMKSPLTEMIRKPRNMMEIYENVTDSLIERWNSFVHKHDSLDHHDGLAKMPTRMSEYFASVVMMIFNTHLDYKHHVVKLRKTFSADPQLHLRFWMDLMMKEYERRQLSIKLLFGIILNAVNPINVTLEIVKFIWWTVVTWSLLSPWYVWREIEAIRCYVFLNQNVPSDCIIGFMINYIPILIGAVKEYFYFISLIFNAPRLFIEEIFSKTQISPHCLQSAVSGRKVVSWSKQISCEELKSKSRRNQQTHSEVLLSTVSSCLMNFFEQTEKTAPSHVRINFRSIPYAYLFGTKFVRNGVLGMMLPVEPPSVRQLVGIRQQILRTRQRQIVTYLMSLIQIKFDFLTTVMPSIWLQVVINFLSRKFSVNIAEVLDMDQPEPAEYFTRFNAEIIDVLYFRTPQANTSTAITIQRFKNEIRLCVMCDANLAGKHHHISSHFYDAFHQIPVARNK
jgi:hypothetical protein